MNASCPAKPWHRPASPEKWAAGEIQIELGAVGDGALADRIEYVHRQAGIGCRRECDKANSSGIAGLSRMLIPFARS